MRRVTGRVVDLEVRSRARGRVTEGWRLVLGQFVGTGPGDLLAEDADDLARHLATNGERPTFAALIAACHTVVAEAVA